MKDADLLWREFLHLVRFAHEVQHLFCAGAKLNHFRPFFFLSRSNWLRLRHRWRDGAADWGINGLRNRRRGRRKLLALHEVKDPGP